MGEAGGPLAERAPKGVSQVIYSQPPIGKLGKLFFPRENRTRPSRAERVNQGRHCHVGLAVDHEVDRGQTLVVHAPAVVQPMIERYLDELRREVAANIL